MAKDLKITFILSFFTLLLGAAFAQDLIPREVEGKWGYWNKSTDQFAIEGLEKAKPFIRGIGMVRQAGKWGALNEEMEVVIPIENDKIFYLTEGVFAYQKDRKTYLYGMPDAAKYYRDAAVLKDSKDVLVLADKKGRYGLIRANGEAIFPFQYFSPPEHLKENLLFAKKKREKIQYGLYSQTGDEIIPPAYYHIREWGDKHYKGETVDGLQTLFDRKGNSILKDQEKQISSVSDHFIILQEEEKRTVYVRQNQQQYDLDELNFRGNMVVGWDAEKRYTIISPKGNIATLKAGQQLRQIRGGFLHICDTDSSERCLNESLLDMEGNVIIPPDYAVISWWNERWAIVQPSRREEKYGLVYLETGELLLEPTYKMIELYDHNFLRVYDGEQVQFLDPDLQPAQYGVENLPLEGEYYYSTRLYELERLRVNQGLNFTGTIDDMSNKMVVPIKADNVKILRDKYNNDPENQLLVVRLRYNPPHPEAALMDINGKAITGFLYSGISYHEAGLIHVYARDTIDGGVKVIGGLMDFEGNIKIPVMYDKIHSVTESHIIVEKYGLQGVINHDNEQILPFRYGRVMYAEPGFFLINRFGKWGIARLDGSIMTEPLYDELKPQKTGEGGFEAKLNKKTIYLDSEGKNYENE
jgi:hypothetical protein